MPVEIRDIPLKNTPPYKNTPPPIRGRYFLGGGVFLYGVFEIFGPPQAENFEDIHHFLKGKCVVLGVQIALKMKKIDARG